MIQNCQAKRQGKTTNIVSHWEQKYSKKLTRKYRKYKT